ncbi:ATP-grasp domain-containing protein [Bacteroidales bacterium]
MNFLLLSPHFPPNYRHFGTALKKAGANVLGIGDTPYENLHVELKGALTEYYKVDDLHHYDQLVKALGYFTHRYGKIEGLDSHNEYWLETEARLRTDFNIKGIRIEQLAAIKKKSVMKEIFRGCGLNVAPGKVFHQLDEALAFASTYGYPMVAKPDSGVGASNTYKIENEQDIRHFFANPPKEDYIFETFVDGTIFSFDGLVDENGKLLYYNAMRNEKGVMETVNDDTHIYYYTLRDIPADLEEAGHQIIRAFDLKARFFHFEFFREKDGSLIALEVNMRPPGGFTTDMWNYSGNLNIYQVWADMVVNHHNKLEFSRLYNVCFVGRKQKYAYLHPKEDILNLYGDFIPYHDQLDKAFSKAMGDYCFLVRADNEDKLFEIQRYIHAYT